MANAPLLTHVAPRMFTRMALFQKKSPDLAGRRAALLARLPLAETQLAELRQAAVTAARNGTAVDAAAAWQAQFELDAARAALAEIDREIEQAAEQARIRHDRQVREATAKALTAAAEDLDQAAAPFSPACQELRSTFTAMSHLIGPSRLAELLGNLATEIPQAIAVHVAELRARAEQTLAGTAPPQLPAPFVPEIVQSRSEVEGPTLQVFCLANISWLHNGKRETGSACQIYTLPVEVAQKALKRGFAVELTSPRFHELREGAKKHGWPDLFDSMKTYDLDPPDETITMTPGGKMKHYPKPFANIREHEPVKTVWVDRPEHKPSSGGEEF